jgi:molybdopterin-binding protein
MAPRKKNDEHPQLVPETMTTLKMSLQRREKGVISTMVARFSARNQLRAKVKSVKLGAVMAEVVVALADGQEIVSAITRTSAESLNLKEGDDVIAIIKSTEVMIGVNE